MCSLARGVSSGPGKTALARVPGAGRIENLASDTREIEVILDPAKARAAGVTVGPVRSGQCFEVNGCLVIGSMGTVGFVSYASSLSTTSMTPYIRTQCPGKVQT